MDYNDLEKRELRKKAEEVIKNQENHTKDKSLDRNEVIHELRVHQIELEMQNEELRGAQVTLEKSHKEYLDLYDFAPVGYFTLDEKGIILKVNLAGASLLNVERLNLLKNAFIQYIDPDDQNKFHHHIIKAKENGIKDTIELKLLQKDKSSFYVHVDTIRVLDEYGNFKEFRIGLIDITNQKKDETVLRELNTKINKMLNIEIDDYEKAEIKLDKLIENLKSSNRELEQFAHVSSHDLKEPLRMITSFLQLLQRRYADKLDEDANDFINFAVEGAKRLNLMINDLLEYSRIGSNEIEFEYLQGEKILEIVLIELEPLIDDNHAIVTYDPLPLIYANEQMMIQLFQNIIGNAIKYHGKIAPVIHISADKIRDEYVFAIKDNGIGIDKKHIGRIFTIFQRLHSREEYEGTGIGLAISQRILQKHHGIIWAESELEKGTTFYFSIPDYKDTNYEKFSKSNKNLCTI
jgi:chemotaxis family two-component system sensor kinase Cph1